MEVVVPDLGDFADVEIIEILVKVGDQVNAEQGLVVLETEKATMDIPSPAAGTVGEIKVKLGDRISKGSTVLVLVTAESDAATSAPQSGSSATNSAASKAAASPNEQAPSAATDAAGSEAPAGSTAPVTQAPPAGEAAAPTEPQPVLVPDLGDFSEVEIIEILVKAGDRVTAEQGLLVLETEKATMDVPAPLAGEVIELKVKVGDRVSVGKELLILRPSGAAAAPAAAAQKSSAQTPAAPVAATPAVAAPAANAAQKPAAARPAAPAQKPADVSAGFAEAHASPSVRKLARELGVALGRVRGTGVKGRVTVDDVKAFVKDVLQSGGAHAAPALPAVPVVDFAKYGAIDVQPLTRIQKISGPRLHASWVNIPHVTQHDEADITELEHTRATLKAQAQERGIRLTPLAFVLRACVLALAEMPMFKSSLSADGASLVTKHYTHIGFAADTPKGLVVPVIRDADKKDVYELAKSLATLSERARDGKLSVDDMQGGVFTISSLGGIGGRFFTPIINAPEVAILGVSRHQFQPVYRDGGFVPRLMLPLSLSYDHRVIDGANAARFTTRLAEILGDVGPLLEAIP